MAPPPMADGRTDSAAVVYHDHEADPFAEADLFDEEVEQEDDEDHDYLTEESPLLAGDHGRSRFGWLFGWWHSEEPHETVTDEHAKRAEQSGQPPTQENAESSKQRFALDARTKSPDTPDAGVLEKRSPWWVEGWRKRCYVIRDRKLLYFNPGSPDRPLGVIDFGLLNYEIHRVRKGEKKENAEDQAEVEKLKVNCCDPCQLPLPEDWEVFYLKATKFPTKVFAFRGPGEEVEKLLEMLQKFAKAAQIRPPDFKEERYVVSLKNFWRYPFIRETEFVRQIESGDILLFRGTDRAAKLQRLATGALYDHVALLLRTPQGAVLLEATGSLGVNLLEWDHFMSMRWHKIYDWMAYRKVYFPRSEEQMKALETFIRSVLGNPYNLSVAKLIKKVNSECFDQAGVPIADGAGAEFKSCTSIPPAANADLVEQLPPRTFFCSELTAACLKRCGVIAGARGSTSYWPGTFSQRSSDAIELHDGVYLGEEQLLVFDS